MTIDLDKKSIEIDCGDMIPFSISFREDGSQFVGGGIYPNDFTGWLQQRLVKDGHEVPGTQVNLTARVHGVVVSKDGKWIINGDGKLVEVRRATDNTQVLQINDNMDQVLAIDVSNDSTQFASGSQDHTVNIYNIAGKRLLAPLRHDYSVIGVKFSPSGDYIATAASGGDGKQELGSLRVWNAKSGGNPVIDIPVLWKHYDYPSTPLAWSNDSKNLFYTAVGKITCLTISTSQRSEWSVPTSLDPRACLLATNGKFIACSAGGSISFWDPISHTQLGSTILRDGIIFSLALSPDNSHLACGTILGTVHKIGLYTLGDILSLKVLVDPTCRLPLMNVSEVAFKPWIEGDMTNVEAILSEEIVSSTHPSHHTLANRAVVRARLKQWPESIEDAKKSLSVRSSTIGHIAHAVALLGRGARADAFSAFDLTFKEEDGTDQTSFLSLIKAVLMFVSGDHAEAIAHANDILTRADDRAKYDYLQVLGAMYHDQGDAERANEAFEFAKSLSFSHQGFNLVTISLIFGKTYAPLAPSTEIKAKD